MPNHPDRVRAAYYEPCPSCGGCGGDEGYHCSLCEDELSVTSYAATLWRGRHFDLARDAARHRLLTGPTPEPIAPPPPDPRFAELDRITMRECSGSIFDKVALDMKRSTTLLNQLIDDATFGQ